MRKRYVLTGLLIGYALIVLLPGDSARGDGAIFRSQHFAIHNMSGATAQGLQDFATTLEHAYTEVATFLEKAPPSSIWVSLEDRRAIPSACGGKLAFYRYGGRIQAEAAAHEIVHLTTGYTSSPVIEEGLAVYIVPPHAVVIYAWGTAPQWQIAQPGWSRVRGEFVEGALKVSLQRPAMAMYRLQPDGTLDATYEWAGGISRAHLTWVKAEPAR
jgi:hypothetical protein